MHSSVRSELFGLTARVFGVGFEDTATDNPARSLTSLKQGTSVSPSPT